MIGKLRRPGQWLQVERWMPLGFAVLWVATSSLSTLPALGQSPSLPPPPAPASGSRVETVEESADSDEPMLGAPAAFGPLESADEAFFAPAGTALRSTPDRRIKAERFLDFDAEGLVLERRSGWALVRFDEIRGWVLVGSADSDSDLPVEALQRTVDPERLRAATRVLGPNREFDLGPFRLLVADRPADDSDDLARIRSLQALTAALVEYYEERFGVAVAHSLDEAPRASAESTPGAQREVVVLFASEDQYRSYARQVGFDQSLAELGHVGGGLMALFQGPGDDEDFEALWVHEVAHLLAERAFGPRLPPWLEEGLAEDLAFHQIDRRNSIEQGYRLVGKSLRGRRTVEPVILLDERGREIPGERRVVDGAKALVRQLLEHLGDDVATALPELFDLSWEQFANSEGRRDRYTLAALWIRFLARGGPARSAEGRRVDAFRRYLAAVAAGGPPNAEELLAELGCESQAARSKLYREFAGWVVGLEPPPGAGTELRF